MSNYYNEIDPHAAQTIRNLISAGLIPAGVVDTRSIEDVVPAELAGFEQCHFFAGVAVWSYALGLAGWPAGREVWTGSCPCQPFSPAGKGLGFADERHLWPYWLHLIAQRLPAEIHGEQVASKDANPWIDLVQTDLEALGYAFTAVAFPSAGVGAPHNRERTYWVAVSHRQQYARATKGAESTGGHVPWYGELAERVANTRGCIVGRQTKPADNIASQIDGPANKPSGCGGALDRPGPTNGLWRDADWLGCLDDKWRPVEPGSFPLAHGAPARVGRLRAYGNAINAEAAACWLECYLATTAEFAKT